MKILKNAYEDTSDQSLSFVEYEWVSMNLLIWFNFLG